jgi:hypothetical protein
MEPAESSARPVCSQLTLRGGLLATGLDEPIQSGIERLATVLR